MFSSINYVWRLIATAFSFFAFGVGGLLLTLVVFPSLNIFCKNKQKRTKLARHIIHKSFRFFITMMSNFGMFHFDIEKAEQELTKFHGKLIIANHPSLIDVVVLIAILPQADCIVKKGLWDNFFLKGVVKAAGYIKNTEDPERLFSACSKSLQSGYSLIIFPEGTRTKPTQPLKFQRGASNIAIRCSVDLVPVVIHCHPSTLTKNEPWYSIPYKKADFSVRVGKPVEVDNFVSSEQSLSVSARRMTSFIQDYFVEENKNYA
ncbi:lysophospholipid acyltransferase family protein [Aliikangiella coralliicola]|uniref:1-acyl-sn-glycerol-3-phosphate acyltransferase n=1 Tax=Aliikangiella coralliicola TaxID=2592383 RepID=A0A545UEG3_9GAMM|nr:lysophospholipid acyltransferase family protein [Aliikangiella coralliicola]TQV87866.1 1-acyl-sn-glycerol-3-phosphate acyltransferase [Aliikangiella coralliicola]